MDLTAVISRVFSIGFILILYYFIFRVLLLMRRDRVRPSQSGAEPVSPEWGLQVIRTGQSGLRRGTVIPLRSGLSIGRNRDNSVVLEDPYISTYHVQFTIHDGRFVIADLDSTNGTLLNQTPLRQKTYLKVDDTITLGSTVFRVVD